MKPRIFLLLTVILFSSLIVRGEKVYDGFSGGMLVHTGYLFGQDNRNPYSMQGATFGIGGAMRVHLVRHLRIGAEGYVSSMPSSCTDRRGTLQSGSYLRAGWGGLLADAYWQCGKAWPYIGTTIGGGVNRGLYVVKGSENDYDMEEQSMFRKQSYAWVCPFVGCDYVLTQSVHLTFRVDWLLAIHKDTLIMPTGPRLYLGFMFCH